MSALVVLIVIPVVPDVGNPAYWDVQAGYLTAYVRCSVPNPLRSIEEYARSHEWVLGEERHIREFPQEDIQSIPTDILEVLKADLWHVCIKSYPPGGGPELAPPLCE